MKKESIRKLAWGAFVLVLLTWIVWPDLAEYAFPVMRELAVEQRGQFGDSFGALNALFTGLAFVGVALTFYLQVVDRREREAQRTEEDFEARFFRLNDSLREVVAGMETTHYIDGEPRTESRGKDVFARYVQSVTTARLDQSLGDMDKPRLQRAIQQYLSVFDTRMDDLAPYFRMLYRLIRFIDRANISSEKKVEFAEIVRAELSPSELRLLALNCLTGHGKKFKDLVVRYHLLKHLPEDDHPLNKDLFLSSFDPSAFLDDNDPRPIAPDTPPTT